MSHRAESDELFNPSNEAILTIEIEEFIQSCIQATRQPRSFYENFSDLLLEFDQIYNPDFSYSSLIDLFCTLLYDYQQDLDSPVDLYRALKQDAFKQWQQYFIQTQAAHQNDMVQHRYNEKLNAKSLDKRLLELVDEYQALLVVRVDLAYTQSPNIQQAEQDLEKLRRRINRSKYGDEILLLVWALEQGVSKGYHCHLALIFDERDRTGAWSIAKAIGELWEEITNDQGCYFNCHDRNYLNRYAKRDVIGIGIIYCNVTYQVEKMQSTLAYLAKPDKGQHLRVKTSKKKRSFGMSQR
ncbi:inovirus-type Gp2 protein [Acinetobacter higginsii]|uniref:YagK/YfjJ domain-containing protein n=1 Tax=Acinetobacter higginsii TaxID=70347 RepID=UPI00320ACAD6